MFKGFLIKSCIFIVFLHSYGIRGGKNKTPKKKKKKKIKEFKAPLGRPKSAPRCPKEQWELG